MNLTLATNSVHLLDYQKERFLALHYILDGYNVIKRTESFAKMKLEDARGELVRFIINKRPHGSQRNKVTVVFDGKAGYYMSAPESRGLAVIFAIKTNADQEIKNIVGRSRTPRQIVVVTDDREVQAYVKSCSAQVMSSSEFIGRGSAPRGADDSASKGGLTQQQQIEINKELEIQFGLPEVDED